MPTSGHLAKVDVATLWQALEAAAEVAGLAVYLVDFDSVPPRILYVSERAAVIAGRPAAELVGMNPWEFVWDADRASTRALVEVPDPSPVLTSFQLERADGTLVPIELAVTRIATAGGTFGIGYLRDLTAARKASLALAASEAQYRRLLDAAPDGIVILVRGAIAFLNPRAASLLGVAPHAAVGQPISAFLPPADAALAGARIAEMVRTGIEMPPNDYRVVGAPDRTVEIKSVLWQWQDQPAVLAFARDVSERRAIQRRLVEADRLASLGTLAASVAHEINNPLTYVQLGLQRLERTLAGALPEPLVEPVHAQLRDIDHGIARVASTTKGLRSFARTTDAPPGPVDLAAITTRALRMVDNDLRHRAELHRELRSVPPVTGNESRLEQVIVNLLLNAIQALPEVPTRPPRIEIELDQPTADQVRLVIRDTGRGIPTAIRDQIFEPFFTTRPAGEGMGLGLAVCRTIIESLGGQIAVDSTLGEGTTMTITLAVHHTAMPQPVMSPTPPVATTRLRVLIIDDEALVRDVLARVISADHDVTTADGGEAGLAQLAASPFDVILCDVMMPRMSGREVYGRIAATNPGLERRIVFISGGSFVRELNDFLAKIPNLFLAKPFKVVDVLEIIERAAAL